MLSIEDPPLHWLRIFKEKNVNFHLASDAHRLEDVGNFDPILNLINFVGGQNLSVSMDSEN